MNDPWDIGWETQQARPDHVRVQGLDLAVGAHVRLRPKGRADVFDIALAGRSAVIASIEQDFEDRIHVVVVIDDDPGRDLGVDGKPGHRFFFSPEEIEPLCETGSAP